MLVLIFDVRIPWLLTDDPPGVITQAQIDESRAWADAAIRNAQRIRDALRATENAQGAAC